MKAMPKTPSAAWHQAERGYVAEMPADMEADQIKRLLALEDATLNLPIAKRADAVAKLRAVAIMVERGDPPDDPQSGALLDVIDWMQRD